MLPSAKNYLIRGGFSSTNAEYILIGCFLCGVVGIQIVSGFLHRRIPSHVVDCDHTHEEFDVDKGDEEAAGDRHDYDTTPLLQREDWNRKPYHNRRSRSAALETSQGSLTSDAPTQRPSLQNSFRGRMSTFVSGVRSTCGEGGPCYGYSDPCGQECFNTATRYPAIPSMKPPGSFSNRQPVQRSSTAPYSQSTQSPLSGLTEENCHGYKAVSRHWPAEDSTEHVSRGRQSHHHGAPSLPFRSKHSHSHSPHSESHSLGHKRAYSSATSGLNDLSSSHHHHVAQNAFLSIGLQTSIAIALHKLPEGFITYATNHANPKLGFAVFVALFIHNITEGFAMALPLYLAIGVRWKAMLWSSLLGGISQPLGAGVAALGFHVAGRSNWAPGEKLYGAMFAVTAGIMTSVALQLFSQSLSLTHNRNLCITFAFVGMGILGFSFALTA
ncbi:MAG: hypothetical protein MMC33_005342 [Icmadophila ericetorum]|nr:hypothetical protein [Icmadophila ericetorum]